MASIMFPEIGGVPVPGLRVDLGDVGRLWPFLSLNDLELNLVALLQALVAFHSDGTKMYEDIGSAIASQKTIPFRVIEPLHAASKSLHLSSSSFLTINKTKAQIFSAKREMNVEEFRSF
jgi:hypothetical protein